MPPQVNPIQGRRSRRDHGLAPCGRSISSCVSPRIAPGLPTLGQAVHIPEDEGVEPPWQGQPNGQASAAWRNDVALEMWVYTDRPPVRVRLAGRLDRTKARHLSLVVAELIADGVGDIDFQLGSLDAVDGSGYHALTLVESAAAGAGCHLTWDGSTELPSPPLPEDRLGTAGDRSSPVLASSPSV